MSKSELAYVYSQIPFFFTLTLLNTFFKLFQTYNASWYYHPSMAEQEFLLPSDCNFLLLVNSLSHLKALYSQD